MKLDKLGILKAIFKKVPIPKVPEPKFENLKYNESRTLFKLKKSLNYAYLVQDAVSYKKVKHDKFEELRDYNKIFDSAMNFLIYMVEQDSFYRYRIKMALFMLGSDVFLTHFYENICELGFDKKWDGKTIANIRVKHGVDRRDGKEEKGLFDHLIPKEGWKKIKEEKF